MKRTTWTASGLTALLFLPCATLLGPSGGGLVSAQGGKGISKLPKWDYGELLAHQSGAGVVVSWVSPKGKVGAAGWNGLLKKLAGREGEGEAVEVLNALGERGW